MTPTLEEIQTRLLRIYREFANCWRADLGSAMSEMWKAWDLEDLCGTPELDAVESEFGVRFDRYLALDFYNMTLGEASRLLLAMIQAQGKSRHHPDDLISGLPPETAQRVLLELWQTHFSARQQILLAMEMVRRRE
jgi:hypothetical protein